MEPRRSDAPKQRRRRGLWVLAGVLALLVAARLAVDPIATWRTREALANLEGYRATFSDVSVSVLHLSYSVHGLRLVPTARSSRPAFQARRIDLGIVVGELLRRRRPVLRMVLDRPRLDVRIRGGGNQAKEADLRSDLARLSPFHVQRIEVKRAEVDFRDEATGSPALRLRDLDATVENLATRLGLLNGEPTTLAASGTLQRSGQVSVFVTADPFTRRLSFAGRGAVRELELPELAVLLARKGDVLPEKGTIDVAARFHAREGHLTGEVKPVLKGAEVKPARSGAPALKAWLADAALKISSHVPGRDRPSGVVPIQGDLTNPKADLWTTVWAVLRNSFVAGVESGLAQPTPEKSRDSAPQARAPPPARRPAPTPGPVERGHPPLADAPDELFLPGAVERIQEALAARGYLERGAALRGRIDSATMVAIRKLQSDQDLARTGVPDHETLRRLGLDFDALVRRNPVS
jgi:Domain of Unknown Function (DUF748)/Putative peptidoglycan binding domain